MKISISHSVKTLEDTQLLKYYNEIFHSVWANNATRIQSSFECFQRISSNQQCISYSTVKRTT